MRGLNGAGELLDFLFAPSVRLHLSALKCGDKHFYKILPFLRLLLLSAKPFAYLWGRTYHLVRVCVCKHRPKASLPVFLGRLLTFFFPFSYDIQARASLKKVILAGVKDKASEILRPV